MSINTNATKIQIDFRGRPFSLEVTKREGFGYHVHRVLDQNGEDMPALAPVIDFICQGQIAEVMEVTI